MDLQHWLFLLVSIAAAAFGAGFVIVRRRRERRDAAAHARLQEKAKSLPLTLYPVIDPNICMGSLSCLKACPEGDILGIVDGVAKLLEPAHCIGHGRCAAECPVNAIKLVFGHSERGVDLPEVSGFFESSRPGVHIVGELGGMGLIKNAVAQGVQCAEHIARTVKGQRDRELADIAIVGAGPAGLAAAVSARASGLSFHVLEQDTLGGAIAHYPRQKVVMSEPVSLPAYGTIHKQFISKEELLSTWRDVLGKTGVQVSEGVRVTGVEGEDGDFRVQTSKGEVRARKVVLAIGRRGTPRKLGISGENLAKVSYRLVDPQQYEGCTVAVVGGGDSALEAASQLVEQSDAEVTLVHRGAAFERCREANRQKILGLKDQRKLQVFFESKISRIEKEELTVDTPQGPRTIPNDFVIVCAGGELPIAFLEQLGVKMQRLYGTTADDAVADANAPRGSAKEDRQRKKDARFAWILFGIGAAIVLGLTWMGWGYYILPMKARAQTVQHAMLRSSGPIGHGIGVGSTLFLFTNFLYAIRKRWRVLKRTGRIKRWLTMHMFIGYMGPFTIAFHAAFQSKNQLATYTAISLGVVVLTGIVGRFFYGMVPNDNGRMLELSDVMQRWHRLRERVEDLMQEATDSLSVRALLQEATATPANTSLAAYVLRMPKMRVRAERGIRQLQPLFPNQQHYSEFKRAMDRLHGLRASVIFYKSLRRFFSSWRLLHTALAVFLALMILAHIGVELYLGYFWIFS